MILSDIHGVAVVKNHDGSRSIHGRNSGAGGRVTESAGERNSALQHRKKSRAGNECLTRNVDFQYSRQGNLSADFMKRVGVKLITKMRTRVQAEIALDSDIS